MSETIEVELDDARELMYEDLVERIGEERVKGLLADALVSTLTDAYDQREQLEAQVKKQQ